MSKREKPTVEWMMGRMGFPEGASTDGPFVTDLRKLVARQIDEGMTNRSAGSWAPGNHSDEDRAKALLALEWALRRGHSPRVEVFDPIVSRTTNIRTWKKTTRVRWEVLPAWLGDRQRELACKFRVWRDRYVLRLRNPYA